MTNAGLQSAVYSSQSSAGGSRVPVVASSQSAVDSSQAAVGSPQLTVNSAPAPEANYAINNVVESVVEEVAPVPQPKVAPAPPQPQSQPVNSAPVADPLPQNTAPRRAPASPKRLSMDMLGDLDSEVAKAAANQNQEKKVLTREAAEQLFEAYKAKLQAENKSVLHSQFCMMRLEVYPPDEVRLISPSGFTDGYAKDQKTPLIDYYTAETGMVVRITTEIQEDEAIKAAQSITVLSKSEMFEAMANKNPHLAALKDGLGMTIEY